MSRRVAIVQGHRTWCSLWTPLPWCDCRVLDAVELVDWWVGQAMPATPPALTYGPVVMWGPALEGEQL